jgi:CRISPR-associated protein Cas1
MLGRIVEIAEEGRYLCLYRGFLVVQATGPARAEVGRVPLDDLSAVIANGHGLSYSHNLLVALGERGVPFVLCGAHHNVIAMLLAADGHHLQARRFDAQMVASLPTRKRLWAQIVRAKLAQQAATLSAVGAPTAPLQALVAKVRSGDPDNLEAQGARRYWGLLMGVEFRRDQAAGGVNALLNYGYTVLRACTARAVVAAGLHPTLSLHHRNEGNALRLVDDLMEPFRPIVDLRVWHLARQGRTEVDAATKRELVAALFDELKTDAGHTPLTVCAQRLAVSLAQVFLGERQRLDLPAPGLAPQSPSGLGPGSPVRAA